MEKTLSIIKPDGVQRGLIGEVVKRLEQNSLNIVAMKMIHMTKEQAKGFYAVHRGAALLREPDGFYEFRPGGCHGFGRGKRHCQIP